MSDKKINYYTRDFRGIRNELIGFIQKFYPTTYQDFDDASIGSLLIDLVAAVGDMLSYNTDRAAQEISLEYAQERRSLYSIARTRGLKIPNRRPAVTVVSVSADVPARGTSCDLTYAPFIVRGAQVLGAGQSFELKYDVDFSSPYSATGSPNRTIIPNVDGAGRIVSYTITKQELAVSGRTKFYKRPVFQNEVRPFFELTLPDLDVISVESVTSLDGTEYNRLPTTLEQNTPANKWYIVDNLIERQVFTAQPLIQTDRGNIVAGKWIDAAQRVMYEFTDKGYCIVRFGNGEVDTTALSTYSSVSTDLLDRIGTAANNFSLGSLPRGNTTYFIKYRVGGGVTSNIGANVLRQIGEATIVVSGQNPTINQQVQSTIRVNNPIPAFGGADQLSIEELRNLIGYNFAARNRAVTLEDYYATVYKMNGEFGVPHKLVVAKRDNKIEINVVGLDENKKLTNVSTDTLKENIAAFLSKYKMVNDYVTVRDGRVVNLAFQFDILLNSQSDRLEVTNSITTLTEEFVNSNSELGRSLFLGALIQKINAVEGVLNVIAIRVYNKVGGNYSENVSLQPYLSTNTNEINLNSTQTVIADYNDIFELKFKDRDVMVRFKLN